LSNTLIAGFEHQLACCHQMTVADLWQQTGPTDTTGSYTHNS